MQVTPIPPSAPLTFNTPIGPYEIVATTQVSGNNRELVEISFAGSGVPFVPVNVGVLPILLSPSQTGIQTPFTAIAGQQTINIQVVTYTPPGINTQGTIKLSCIYTNQQGQGGDPYNGTIATWNIMNLPS